MRELAPEVELVSVRVLRANLKGSAFTFAHGLDWCIENGVRLVNLSLSTANESYAETFWGLVDQAAYRNVILVSALNNERKRSIPSEFAGVFSVACAPGHDRERVWFNRRGPAEWGAAGVDVEVAWSGGRDDHRLRQQLRGARRHWPPGADPRRAPGHHSLAGQDDPGRHRAQRARARLGADTVGRRRLTLRESRTRP